MPQVFKIGSYWVYFWANENKPLEPIHVHISKGKLQLTQPSFGLQKPENTCWLTTTRIMTAGSSII